jgi:hypothetical protein
MILDMQDILGDPLQYRHFGRSFKWLEKALENKNIPKGGEPICFQGPSKDLE